MIITIGGTPGAGKDSVGEILSKKLSFKMYSIGDMRRKLAEDKNISLEELNRIGENEIWTDQDVDNYQEDLGMTMNNIIVVSRLGFHFIPSAYKVFLKCDYGIAAERIFSDKSDPYRDVEKYGSEEEVQEHLIKRQESDAERYRKYYGLKIDELKHYDLVVDTSKLSIDDVSDIVFAAVKKMIIAEEKQIESEGKNNSI